MARPTGSDSIISTCSRATTPARATPWRCTSWHRPSRSACTTRRRESRAPRRGAARGGGRRRAVRTAHRVRNQRAPCAAACGTRTPAGRAAAAGARRIDLSYPAAARLDMIREGTTLVEVRARTPGAPDELTRSAQSPPPSLYVQAGAFADAHNAQHLLERLHAAGLAGAFILLPPEGRSRLYRVRLGPVSG